MSVPTAELTDRPSAPVARGRALAWSERLGGGRVYLLAGAAALLIAAFSLLIPSTPSYDPWSWLVWGREIVHLDLQTTGGPTWKPLPMIFTTLFAPFGSAAPDMWLVVARAGLLMSAVMVFKVAVRLTMLLVGRDQPGVPARARLATLAPAVLAGTIAAVSLIFSGGFISDSALGYSEGLLTALVLIAVDRHLDGKHRHAFAIGFFAALDRPEIWLFWGPYGLWLWWKDPGARKLVIGLFVLIPVLWFGPEYWGSGHFFRGVNRAHSPRSNSPAFAKCPFCTELVKHAWPTVLLRVKVVAALAVGIAGALLWRAARARGGWRPHGPREHALAALIATGIGGLVWWVVIAILTQAGFSGNDRYLVLGAALLDIAGGVGFGWAAYGLGGAIERWRARAGGGGRVPAGAVAPGGASGGGAGDGEGAPAGASGAIRWAAVALLALTFMLLPNWVANNMVDVQRTHRSLVYQARLRSDVAKAVRELGGPGRIFKCGSVMTEGFQVPMLAYALGVQTLKVRASPLNNAEPGPPPNVIFQTRANRHAALLPRVRDWPGVPYRVIARLRTFRIYSSCRGSVTL